MHNGPYHIQDSTVHPGVAKSVYLKGILIEVVNSKQCPNCELYNESSHIVIMSSSVFYHFHVFVILPLWVPNVITKIETF